MTNTEVPIQIDILVVCSVIVTLLMTGMFLMMAISFVMEVLLPKAGVVRTTKPRRR